MSDQWEELADEEYHRRPDTTPKPEPRWCNRVEHGSDCPDWCAGKPKPEPRGAMIVDLEGALKRSLLAPNSEPPKPEQEQTCFCGGRAVLGPIPQDGGDAEVQFVHKTGCPKDVGPPPKPETPKLLRRHSWAAASNGVIACKVCGTPIRDNWMTDCPGEPEPPKPCPCGDQGRPGHPSGWCREPDPPPNVAKKHHWTTVDVNPDGPIICRYCEVLMTRENESEECKGQPPDVASEPDTITVEAWMYRDLVNERDVLRAENAALKAKLKAADHLIVTLTDNSARFEAERDEARSENAALKAEVERLQRLVLQAGARENGLRADLQLSTEENTALKAKLANLPADWWEDSSLATWFPFTAAELARAKSDCEKAEAERDEARAEAERREMENSRLVIELAKLREERDAAEAVILEEYESWGSDCSDDLVVMAKEIQRRREKKGGE